LSNNDISPKKSPEERTDSNSSFYGHITVESQVGVGTTFHIYLPASDKAVLETEEVKLITGKGRILVMDDEASLRKGHRLQWLLRRPCFSEFSGVRFKGMMPKPFESLSLGKVLHEVLQGKMDVQMP